MKKIYTFLAFIAVLASCTDRLDVPHNGVLDESNFYKSDEDAAAAIAAAYQDIAVGDGQYGFEHVYKIVNGYLSDEYWAGQQDRTNGFCILSDYAFDAPVYCYRQMQSGH